MWTIICADQNKLGLLEQDLKKKAGTEYEIYSPKIKIQFFKKRKLIDKSIPLLGSYIFCYHPKFKSKDFINSLKFIKGLKYFLNGHQDSQTDIKNFIAKCKSKENEKGLLSQSFFNLSVDKIYKFKSGIFTNKIFKLIELQKSKIRILINNVKVEVNKKDLTIFSKY